MEGQRLGRDGGLPRLPPRGSEGQARGGAAHRRALGAAAPAREGRHRHGPQHHAGPAGRVEEQPGRRHRHLPEGGPLLFGAQPEARAPQEAQGSRGDPLAGRLPRDGGHLPPRPV